MLFGLLTSTEPYTAGREDKKMKECYDCGFNNEDYGCGCPHSDKCYACPIENKKPENTQGIELEKDDK